MCQLFSLVVAEMGKISDKYGKSIAYQRCSIILLCEKIMFLDHEMPRAIRSFALLPTHLETVILLAFALCQSRPKYPRLIRHS